MMKSLLGYCSIVSYFLSAAAANHSTSWAIPMPSHTLFPTSGFSAPTDKWRWNRAVAAASTGRHFLGVKVIADIKHPGAVVDGDVHSRWIMRLADLSVAHPRLLANALMSYDSDEHTDERLFWLRHVFKQLPSESNQKRAPIAMLGYTKFSQPNFEGDADELTHWFYPKEVAKIIAKSELVLPRPFVAVGKLNENWGWLSSYFPNRTAEWGEIPLTEAEQGSLDEFFEMPELIAVFVNQHHNFTHPKIISIPRGVPKAMARTIWKELLHCIKKDGKKDALLVSASSQWGPRPSILNCVRQRMGDEFEAASDFLSAEVYSEKIVRARAVLCLPGIGYDSFRIWETLMAGSMPVLERGVGLDRTLYKLPALLVDDFAMLTPLLVRQGYVEAIYRALGGEWDYRRITQRWWELLISKTAATSAAGHINLLHPIFNISRNFTRPLLHFLCSDENGERVGCGPNTKTIPRDSC